jgi:hypothetical protein
MHRLLAVLGLATALVAPPTRRQTTRLRGTSLAKKGDDYIFEDIAKNLGKGDQDRLYQYQLELAERYGEDKIGRAAPPPKPKKPKQGGTVVVEAVTTPPTTTRAVAPRNSKLRWRGLACGAVVALFLAPGFLEYLITVRTKALALEKSLEALIVAVAAPATDALSAACGAAGPVCASAYGSVAAAAAGAYGAAAPACAKACASVGAAASSAGAGIWAAAGSAYGGVSAATSSAYAEVSATKVGAAVTSGVAKVSARVGPPLARVWRFLISWKGLIFWRPGH